VQNHPVGRTCRQSVGPTTDASTNTRQRPSYLATTHTLAYVQAVKHTHWGHLHRRFILHLQAQELGKHEPSTPVLRGSHRLLHHSNTGPTQLTHTGRNYSTDLPPSGSTAQQRPTGAAYSGPNETLQLLVKTAACGVCVRRAIHQRAMQCSTQHAWQQLQLPRPPSPLLGGCCEGSQVQGLTQAAQQLVCGGLGITCSSRESRGGVQDNAPVSVTQ
jgi:hypothetical protein